MPKKDGAMDDNKKTTKDVVNKKQKQMLNQEEAEKIDVLQTIKDRFRDKGLSGFIKKPEKKERKTIGDLLKREEIDPAKIAEAFGGYVVESLNPSKDELERRLMNRILGGDTRTPAEIDKEIRAARRKEKVDRGTVKKVLKGVQSKAEKRVTAPKPGERSAARKTFSAFMGKQEGDKPVTKKPIRDPKTGEVIANPMQPTKKELARKTKEIKDAARKKFPKSEFDTDISTFRRQARRTKSKSPDFRSTAIQQGLPLQTVGKDIKVKTKSVPAKRATPDEVAQYKKDAAAADAKERRFIGKSTKPARFVKGKDGKTRQYGGGMLPVKSGKTKEAIGTQKAYKGQKEFMKGFPFTVQGRSDARKARKVELDKVTKKLSRRASLKAFGGGMARQLGKSIPGVGMAVAAGEAGARMAAGDKKGAAIGAAEVGSKMIPGVGGVISTGFGLRNVARDTRKAGKVAGVAKKVKRLARGQSLETIKSKGFAKDADKLVSKEFKPFKALKKKARGMKMMGAKTVGGAALRVGGVGAGLEMARRFMLPKAPKPKLDTGIVGKRSAGG